MVTNPDGQSGSLDRGFTVGESAPIITSIDPTSGAINQTVNPLTITGQFFTNPAKVELSKGYDLKTCPVLTIVATKITCNLGILTGQSGEWNVTVTNIADGQSATSTRKFTMLNATA
jgi:hypothetical protein